MMTGEFVATYFKPVHFSIFSHFDSKNINIKQLQIINADNYDTSLPA